MIFSADGDPHSEVINWLQKNADKYRITIQAKPFEGDRFPDDLVVETNCIPDYHMFKPQMMDEVKGFKRKQDIDSTSTCLPTDLGGETLRKGKTTLNQGVVQMTDSNGLLTVANAEALYAQFKKEGYLLFKGLLNKDHIMSARKVIMDNLLGQGVIDESGACIHTKQSGWTIDTSTGEAIAGKSDFMTGLTGVEDSWRNTCNGGAVDAVRDHALLKKVMTILSIGKTKSEKVNNKAFTFSPLYSWLRVKAPNEFTPVHADIFYYRDCSEKGIAAFHKKLENSNCFCKKTDNEAQTILCDECDSCFHLDCLRPQLESVPKGDWFCKKCEQRPLFGTCWIPLGHTPVDHGVLAVLPGTQNLPDYYHTEKIKNVQVSKSYKSHAKNLDWHSASFEMGDVVIFDSHLVHCTSKNKHSAYRLSIDFRWAIVPTGRKNWGKTYHSNYLQKNLREF